MGADAVWLLCVSVVLGVSVVSLLATVIAARMVVRYRLNTIEDDKLPPVTIMKPLRGLDDELDQNLRSFCELDYPRFTLLFCLSDADDPALKVVESLKAEFPAVSIKVSVFAEGTALNPKVRNLLNGLPQVEDELMLISDSNVRVEPGYLRDSVALLLSSERIGLVSNMIVGTGERQPGAIYENLHMNGFVAGGVALTFATGIMPVVVGKSMLMRRSALEAIGGLAAFGEILAEDFMIGREMDRAGFGVRLSGHVIQNVNRDWTLKRFASRHVRWAKLRWHIGGPLYFVELLANPILLSLAGAAVNPAHWAVPWFVGGSCAFKVIVDLTIARVLGSRMALPLFLLSPVKDIIIFMMNLVPFFSNTVEWRGNRVRIGKESRLTRL